MANETTRRRMGYKFRLYPDHDQTILIEKTFGCTRLIWNLILAACQYMYEETGSMKIPNKRRSGSDRYITETDFKTKDREFLDEVPAQALMHARTNLYNAYARFFNGTSKFPRFKSKKATKHSYTTSRSARYNDIRIEGDYIRLPKLGPVKFKQHRPVEGTIKTVTVSRAPDGKYYVSISVETEMPEYIAPTNDVVGIDVGISTFATCSDHTVYENPKFLRKLEKKLADAQRSLSRKTKGSKNRDKARLKVARIYKKITNQKNNFLHQVSIRVVRDNQSIVMEDLSIANMLKNHKLAKAIAEVSWYKFRTMVTYKAVWYGRTLVLAATNFPSSQLCSVCGHKNTAVKSLKVREWTCTNCHTTHNRDFNASMNLAQLAY